MATSESDDFESADEEMNHDIPTTRNVQIQQWKSPITIDSESDDDTEYVPRQPHTNVIFNRKREKYCPATDTVDEKKADKDISIKETHNNEKNEQPIISVDSSCERVNENVTSLTSQKVECAQTNIGTTNLKIKDNKETRLDKNEVEVPPGKNVNMELQFETTCKSNEKQKDSKKQKLNAKKLGTKIIDSNCLIDVGDNITRHINEEDILRTEENFLLDHLSIEEEITESEMPEEMKSNKTFKEVFKPEGWEELGDDIELPKELSEEKLQPILKRLSIASDDTENSSTGWGWANWGVSSLINTASAGVSTLTSHVSHGLTLLEESMALPDEPKLDDSNEEKDHITNDDKEEYKEQSAFGFGNLMSGVSSITKLVESTGSKVMSSGLDTLEAIGKKTMEVLQEGDPGLKKKRAIFINESNKPNLSQVLREAKEKAETIEKTIEEKQKMRKVHFESLFDDYQGLVHLEALEMLSKQTNIKIEHRLNNVDTSVDEVALLSLQTTLQDVEELCDLCEDDEDEDETHEEDLKFKLHEACKDLGVNITYEKLFDVCEDSKIYLTSPMTLTNQELFEHSISVLAQFTAFSVERFHKTAELLLIKERRNTVKEVDSLIKLTHILSKQTGILADAYCNCLNKLVETSNNSDSIKANITTIFMEASNASSYIRDAYKLLIPIIQVGAIY